jgi:hypothetical protein
MKKLAGGLLCALLAAPLTAVAQEGGFIDLMYTLEPELTISDPSDSATLDSGSGLSLRGRIPLEGGSFLLGEYVANDYEEVEGFDIDASVSLLRGGFGVKQEDSAWYGTLELVQQELEINGTSFEDSGFAMSIGLQGNPGDGTNVLYAQIGYLDIGDFGDGLELQAGAAFGLGPQSALVVDYRVSTTEDDFGGEGELTDLRVGLRLVFGN